MENYHPQKLHVDKMCRYTWHKKKKVLVDGFNVSKGYLTISFNNGVQWHTSTHNVAGYMYMYVKIPSGEFKAFWLDMDFLPNVVRNLLDT